LLAENAKRVSHSPAGTSLNVALASTRREEPGTGGTGLPSEIFPTIALVQRIYLIGEVHEGRLDLDRFNEALNDLAAEFGAPNIRWRARVEVCEHPKSGAHIYQAGRRPKTTLDQRAISEPTSVMTALNPRRVRRGLCCELVRRNNRRWRY
jgi:hypothetical protein